MPVAKTTAKSAPKTPAKKATPRRVAKPKPVHPMHELIPSANYAGYVSRKIHGVKDLDILAAAHEQRHNVALFGPTGCAKTTLVYAYGYHHQLPVVNVPCNGAADPEMLFGGWRPQPDGSFRLMPGPLYYVTRYGGIPLLDEIVFMPPKIASLLFSALDGRRVMNITEYDGCEGQVDLLGNQIEARYTVHPDCLFVATWNPEYVGSYQMNQALFNRFNHKLVFDYDPVVEEELITSVSLIEFAEKLRVAARNGDILTPISTNALMELEQNTFYGGLGADYAFGNFLSMFKESEKASVQEALRNYSDAIREELKAAAAEAEEYDDIEDEEFGATQ